MAVIVGQGISVSPVADAELSHESTSTVQNKVVTDAIASEYSTSKTYSVGDVCTHDGKLYECIVDIPTAEGWTLSHWKVSNLGDNVSNLNRQLSDETTGLNTKAPVILETASGAIASFDDGADSMPIKKLVAQIEPVQDLHGYSNPWPAGGGKNLVPMTTLDDIKANNTSGTWNGADYSRGGITFTVLTDNAGNVLGFKINGTSTAGVSIQVKGTDYFTLAAGSYYYTGVSVNNSGYDLNLRKAGTTTDIVQRGNTVTLTLEEDTSFNSMYIWVTSGKTLTNAYVYPMIRNSSVSDATFAPYSNICPISGWTGAEIGQTGKNLLAKPFTFRPAPSVFADCFFIKAGTYTFAFDSIGTATSWRFGISLFDVNGVVLSDARHKPNPDCYFLSSINMFYWQVDVTIKTFTLTIVEDCFIRIWFGSGNTDSSMIASGARLELSSTATSYAPYTGNQISVTFPETIYGCEDEIVSGKLKKTKAKIGASSLTWFYDSARNRWLSSDVPGIAPPAGSNIATSAISDTFKAYSNNALYDNTTLVGFAQNATRFVVRNNSSSDPPDCEFVYDLATEQEYTLTANELNTLYGTNNIWADTGDVEVEYPADTKLYIDNKITQAIANALNS